MKKYLLFTVLVFLYTHIFSQEKPSYEKKTYVSEDGKLYINKDLGIYLWLSTSKDSSSEKYLLKSEKTEKYSNPMYLDTEGFNSFRSPSAVDPQTRKPIYPLQDIIFEIYADESSPTCKLSYNDATPYSYQGKNYLMTNTKVKIEATDANSGVENIFVSTDKQPFSKYTKELTFTEEREYYIQYYAVDNVGNVEDTKSITYVYDKTPPATKRIINEDEHNNTLSERSTITLESNDNGVGVRNIKYKINDGNEYTYTRPLKAANLSQGEYTVTYYAIDKVGNKESEQTYTFYIDKTPPTVIEEVIGKSFFANGKEFSSGKAQLKLTAFDNKAGIKEIRYSINGGEYKVYTKPVFLTQASGNLTITTMAIDNVNNKTSNQTANEKTSIPYIDLSGPTLSHSITGPNFTTRDTLFVNNKTKITLRGKDSEAGLNRIEYSIDGSSPSEFKEPLIIKEEGIHIISYTGYDNVENTSSTSLLVKVDNTGPSISFEFSTPVIGNSDNKNEYPKYVILFLSGNDKVVGLESIKYGFNDSPQKYYSAPIKEFASGDKTIKISASDKLGNKTEETIQFFVRP